LLAVAGMESSSLFFHAVAPTRDLGATSTSSIIYDTKYDV
jgi:hypothetical protein